MKAFILSLMLFCFVGYASAALDTTAVLTVTIHGNGSSDHGDTTKLDSTPLVTSNTVVPDVGYYIDSVLVNGVNVGRVWIVSVTLEDSTDQTLDMYFSANPYTSGSSVQVTSLVSSDGNPFAKIRTYPTYIAYDSVVYISPTMKYDLGGRVIHYGLQQEVGADTVNLVLALDGSPDGTTWYGVDSLAIGTPETAGQYQKIADLSLFRYPYWRFRYSTATALLHGDMTAAGRFYFWAVANFLVRY